VAENQPITKNRMIQHFAPVDSPASRVAQYIRNHPGAQSDALFNRLALDVFHFQLARNPVYRKFCQSRTVVPHAIMHWTEIPAVPASAFKEFEMTCIAEAERGRVFHSSGTTGQLPSRHFHNADSLALYEASLTEWFRARCLPEGTLTPNFVFLPPTPEQAPHSSLVHMFATIGREFGAGRAAFTGALDADPGWRVDVPATIAELSAAIVSAQPVFLAGTAFNFVHLADAMEEAKINLKLPQGSRVMETGGYKGRSRSLAKSDLHQLITECLGVGGRDIICEYGMSELGSQAYAFAEPGVFQFPPWASAEIISPETGRAVVEGETGLIRIFDLANVYSAMAIQTEDLGIRRGAGFELIGRATLSEPRGCSLQSAS
jgi:hypothetical protein